jgi:hypothetical protein
MNDSVRFTLTKNEKGADVEMADTNIAGPETFGFGPEIAIASSHDILVRGWPAAVSCHELREM